MKIFIYVLIGILAIGLIVGIIIGFIFFNKNLDKINSYLIWKKLYKLAKDYDYYLLNNVILVYDNIPIHISHMLFADKNIYIISSRYYSGNLSSDTIYSQKIDVVSSSNAIIFKDISNPILFNENRCLYFKKIFGENNPILDEVLKSVVVTNNSVNYKFSDSQLNPFSYLCHRKELYKLIVKTEKESKYAPLNVEDIQRIVDYIHQESVRRNNIENKNKKGSK